MECADLSALSPANLFAQQGSTSRYRCHTLPMRSWPHAPSKSVTEAGAYMITASTDHKDMHFNSRAKLDHLNVDDDHEVGSMENWP